MNQSFSKIWIIVIIAVLIAGGILAWQYWWVPREKVKTLEEKTPTLIEYNKERLPYFEDFPILERFEGSPASVDLSSHPEAPRFRTVLTEGAKRGPNFAGHYTIVSWGCGTECQAVAVVDAKTGFVYFAPFSTWAGAEFRLDSNLFIANPPKDFERYQSEGRPTSWLFTDYYEWKDNQFILVYSTKDETANWQTYRNGKYGFEFKYPPAPSGCERCKIDEESDEHFWINRTELTIMDSGGLTLSEFVDKETKEFTIEKRDNILIGGREGISVDYRFGGMNRFGSATFVEKGGKVFVFQFTAGGFCCDPNVDRIYEMEVYGAMLSTFRFLE